MPCDFSNFVLRKPRHDVADEGGLAVTIQREAGRRPLCFQADLLDLSRDGFRLRSAVPLAAGETFVLELSDERFGLQLALSGTVRWQQAQPEEVWLLGCQTETPLDWETLGELFLSEVLSTAPRA